MRLQIICRVLSRTRFSLRTQNTLLRKMHKVDIGRVRINYRSTKKVSYNVSRTQKRKRV